MTEEDTEEDIHAWLKRAEGPFSPPSICSPEGWAALVDRVCASKEIEDENE
jgi:hypothetical protein